MGRLSWGRMSRSGPSAYARAEVYDALHAPTAGAAARQVLAIAKRVGAPLDGVWYEPACGSGRVLIALAGLKGMERARLRGVDLEPAMVRMGRRRVREEGLGGRVRVALGDMSVHEPAAMKGKVGVALCLDNSVRHLGSDAAMVRHLTCVRRMLAPGGVYLVGVGLMGEFGEFASEDVVRARVNREVWSQVFSFVPPEVGVRGAEGRRERVYVHLSAGEIEESSAYVLRTYTLEQWGAVVRKAGMVEAGVRDERGRELGLDRVGYGVRVLRGG